MTIVSIQSEYRTALTTALRQAFRVWYTVQEQEVAYSATIQWLDAVMKQMNTRELIAALADGEMYGNWLWLTSVTSPICADVFKREIVT